MKSNIFGNLKTSRQVARNDFAKELLDRLDDVAHNEPLLRPMIKVIQDHIREVRDR